ncbi:uncharacterized protein [Danio rerio]|uniref:Uncharacterized protein n=1 Tax=Danio rerio TaxID=7955 RepID=A0AC58HHS8_DANRE
MHRDKVLRHLRLLGLQVNREKSKLAPVQRISFLGMELDSITMVAHLSEERARLLLNCLRELDSKLVVPLKFFQRLLGHMASAAAVTPLGLLHETTSALASRSGPQTRMARGHTPGLGYCAVSPRPQPLERPLVPTGRCASRTGVQPCCCFNRRFQHGLGGRVSRACGCGPLEGCPAALAYQSPRAVGSVPRSPPFFTGAGAATRAGQDGQYGGGGVYQPHGGYALSPHVSARPPSAPLESPAAEIAARHSRPRHAQSCSRCALTTAVTPWRMETPPRVCSADMGAIRGGPDRSVCFPRERSLPVVFFPDRGLSRHGCTGPQLASGHAQVCVSPSEPARAVSVQGQGGRGTGSASCAPLAQPDLDIRALTPRDGPPLADPFERGPTLSGTGHHLAPSPRSLEPPHVVPRREEDLGNLPTAVVNTITQARAPSTRRAYALKWSLFTEWCVSRREDPRNCQISVVLSFLQEKLDSRLSPSTLKVYVAAISAYHSAVAGGTVGKHNLVIQFLRGARRINPSRPPLMPSWDLALVLTSLRSDPFEPLESVSLRFLSLKTALLVALASIKRVGDLEAFSVSDSCLEFGPDYSHVILRPRPGYVPKVPTTPFRDQVVNLQALPPEEADPALSLICPVRALRIYVDRTQNFRSSEQLFVCYGGRQQGSAVSKQRLSHWIVDAISLAYSSRGQPCPPGVRAHSTRSVASSWARARGASLTDICRAAGWATPNTFARFYNLRVEPVSSRVLGNPLVIEETTR